MKIHTDKLTARDLYREAFVIGVECDLFAVGSRKRDHGFQVRLSAPRRDELHRYTTNSGNFGAGTDIACTWDEWGLFIAALFKLEPTAIIGNYDGEAEFLRATRDCSRAVSAQYPEDSICSRTHTAPWLGE